MSTAGTQNIRPGNTKKRHKKPYPKGRQLDLTAQAEIKTLLANRPRDKHLLIEYLHLIQDQWSSISAVHLHALAEELNLPQAAVYEVASFYHHFDVVKENQSPPAKLTIRVCESLSCQLAGANEVLDELQRLTADTIRVVAAPCMGLCDKAPAAAVGKNYIGQVTPALLLELADKKQNEASLPDHLIYQHDLATAGYQTLHLLKNATLSIDDAIQSIADSGLKGLGGAGFSTASKLTIVRNQPAPRYLCVNADEGEPGTFKDRHILSSQPHQFLEGLLIAARLIDADSVYIYLRDEYVAIYQLLQREIQHLLELGVVTEGFIHLRRGAGAYICGEESAMIESIEGKRGLPRQRPPYVAHQGLFQRPTLVQNVETLYWLAPILSRGAQWFKNQGKRGAAGLRSFSLSGRVKNPGLIVAPAGSNVTELIELAGGMLDGHLFKAYLPGGASGGILPASLAHLPLDFGSLNDYGCFVGSHAIIILSDQDSIKQASQNLIHFFKQESCGQCTPCRVGCEKADLLLAQPHWDKPLLKELCATMADASICGLGQAAPNPILSTLTYFPEEV